MNYSDVSYRYPTRFIVVDGCRVAYVDVSDELPETVVFLHDAAGDLDDFAEAHELLAPAFRVIGLDLPGFGKSDKPPVDDRVPFYAALLEGFLTSVELSRVTLAGHGVGATVAAYFAARYPSRVKKLILSAPLGARETTSDEVATAADLYSYDRIVAFDDDTRKGWYESMTAGWSDGLDQLADVRNSRAHGPQYRPWARAVEESARSALAHSIGARLNSLNIPTLVIWGTDDPVVLFGEAATLRENIPGSELATLHGCGHLPMFEQPEAYAATIEQFITGTRRAPSSPLVAAGSVYSLEPLPGLSPEIGRLANALLDQTQMCGSMVAGLSIDDCDWRPDESASSIGALILRLGVMPTWYLYEVLRGDQVPPHVAASLAFDPSDLEAPMRAQRKTPERLLAEVDTAHSQLVGWLGTRKDADLNKIFKDEKGLVKATLRWVLSHLIADAAFHRGQIAYVKRLLAARS